MYKVTITTGGMGSEVVGSPAADDDEVTLASARDDCAEGGLLETADEGSGPGADCCGAAAEEGVGKTVVYSVLVTITKLGVEVGVSASDKSVDWSTLLVSLSWDEMMLLGAGMVVGDSPGLGVAAEDEDGIADSSTEELLEIGTGKEVPEAPSSKLALVVETFVDIVDDTATPVLLSSGE